MNISPRTNCVLPTPFVLLTLLLLLAQPTSAQNTVGRWAFSFHANGNVWLSDYNRRIMGFGGDAQCRYGLTRSLSMGLNFGFAKYKSGQTSVTPAIPNDYIRLNALPMDLLIWLYVSPGGGISPYIFSGAGLIHYTRIVGAGSYLPDARRRTSIRVPLGIGFENFIQRNLSLDCNAAYVFFDDRTDMLKAGKSDAAVELRLGVNFYLGSSDDDDADHDGLTYSEEEALGTNPTNPDSDEDLLNDGQEAMRLHTDPLNPDSDGDRLKDGDEIYKYYTDPLKRDTDGDGVDDYTEVMNNTDPLVP